MAREATVIDQAVDAWGDAWDVREARPTRHGFDVLLGWPAGAPRGKGGSGGPKVVVTAELARYIDALRGTRRPLELPIGVTTIKRLRRLLGHNSHVDRAAWWEQRANDLGDLTIEAFAKRHGVSVGATSQARGALLGVSLRPPGWWRTTDVAQVLVSSQPVAVIADELGISAGSVRRLRWMLRTGAVYAVSSPEAARSWRKLDAAALATAARLIEGGASGEAVSKILGVSGAAIYRRTRRGDLPKLKGVRGNRQMHLERRAEIDQLLRAGTPPMRIAEMIGVAPVTVYRRRQALALQDRTNTGG